MDILLSQRFLPEHGGSIRWMHEVYRRWPAPVRVITHDYYRHPLGTAEFPTTPAPPAGQSDHVTDANLRMDRRDIFMHDWGIEKIDRLRRYGRMTQAVNESMRQTRDVVRVHCTHAVPEVVSLLPLKWRYGKRLKVICYAHGEEITACRSSRQLRMLMNQAHAIVDVMIANSRYTADLLGEVHSHVVHPGVDLAEFAGAAEAGAALRDRRGWKDRPIVLTLGRLDPRKNHAQVIRAVAALAPRFPGLLYAIAGEGRAMPALRQLVESLRLQSHVEFLGAVDGSTRLDLFGACDLFVMPAIVDGTDVEGFGMVFIEAGACGKPCIAGKTGGQPDAVRHGETGLIVDGTNAAEVTRAMESLLADSAARAKMGAAACEHAVQFDWERVVQRTVQLAE